MMIVSYLSHFAFTNWAFALGYMWIALQQVTYYRIVQWVGRGLFFFNKAVSTISCLLKRWRGNTSPPPRRAPPLFRNTLERVLNSKKAVFFWCHPNHKGYSLRHKKGRLEKVLVVPLIDKESLPNDQVRMKKRCFLGRVEHGLALCHSDKWSPIQDWKKCYMRTSRSDIECFFPFLVSHLFLRNKRSKWFSSFFFPLSRRRYTIGILRINRSTYRIHRCSNLFSRYLPNCWGRCSGRCSLFVGVKSVGSVVWEFCWSQVFHLHHCIGEHKK